jgi:uncharacterized protein (DUF433 family)
VAGAPISLEAVAHQFHEGLLPEMVQRECFPALTLEQVYGVCAYYLRHRDGAERYLQEAEQDFGTLATRLEGRHPGVVRHREHLRELRERAGPPLTK